MNKESLGNKDQAYGDLPIVYPPTYPYEYTDMWFEILRKSREILSPNAVEVHPVANEMLKEIKTIIKKDCQIFTLMNALFGNSFIDLARYMGTPSYLTKSKLDKFRKKQHNINSKIIPNQNPDNNNYKVNDREEQARNNLISNWLKYVTHEEIESLKKAPGITLNEKVALSLYTDDKISAAESLNEALLHNNNAMDMDSSVDN